MEEKKKLKVSHRSKFSQTSCQWHFSLLDGKEGKGHGNEAKLVQTDLKLLDYEAEADGGCQTADDVREMKAGFR